MKHITIEDQFPLEHEYLPYAKKYIDLVPKENIYSHFKNQFSRINEMLGNLSNVESEYRYAEGKWSIKECVRHIIDTEIVFAYRAMCISRGDQTALPGFDQDQYADHAPCDHLTIQELLEELQVRRQLTDLLFSNLPTDAWASIGMASGHPASVRALFYMITGHAEHHIYIFKKYM